MALFGVNYISWLVCVKKKRRIASLGEGLQGHLVPAADRVLCQWDELHPLGLTAGVVLPHLGAVALSHGVSPSQLLTLLLGLLLALLHALLLSLLLALLLALLLGLLFALLLSLFLSLFQIISVCPPRLFPGGPGGQCRGLRPQADQGAQRGEEEERPEEGVYHGGAPRDGAELCEGPRADSPEFPGSHEGGRGQPAGGSEGQGQWDTLTM